MSDRLGDAMDELRRQDEARAKLVPSDDIETWSDEKLLEASQGCRELSCLYHGPINLVLRQRERERDAG